MAWSPSDDDSNENAAAGEDPPDLFEDEATPVIATGTRDVGDQARAALQRATGNDSPGIPNDDVAALAHDLKNPLTILMVETMQIEQRLGVRCPPSVQRGLERIAQNAAYIDRLISDLLAMSSAEAGNLELRFERIDLTRLLRD